MIIRPMRMMMMGLIRAPGMPACGPPPGYSRHAPPARMKVDVHPAAVGGTIQRKEEKPMETTQSAASSATDGKTAVSPEVQQVRDEYIARLNNQNYEAATALAGATKRFKERGQ